MSSCSLVEPGEEQSAAHWQDRVRRGVLWNGATTVLLRAGTVIITAVVVHLVTPREFGVFAIALTVHTVISSMSDAGVGISLARGNVDVDRYAPTVTTVAMTSALAFAAAMALLARPLATALGASDAAGALRVLALSVFIGGLSSVPNAQLTRDFRQDAIFRANALAFLPGNAALLLLAWAGYGAMAFAWSRVLLQALIGIGLALSVRRRYAPGWTTSRVVPVLRFGLPLAAANLVNYAWLNADYVIVGRLLGPVLLGAYTLAFTVASWPTALLGPMLNTVAMPGFSRVGSDTAKIRPAVEAGLRAVALVAFPISALSAVLARPLVLVLYGRVWGGAALPLSVLAVNASAFTISLVFANLLVGLGRTRVVLTVQLIWVSCLVPAMLLGELAGGLIGVAVAHVVVTVLLMLPTYLYVLATRVGLQVRPLLRCVWLPAAASACSAATALLVSWLTSGPVLQLLLGGCAGCCVYVLLTHRVLAGLLPSRRLQRAPLAATGSPV